jgi:hypothetical protein
MLPDATPLIHFEADLIVGHVNQVIVVIDCKMAPLADLAEILDRGKTVDRSQSGHVPDLFTLAERAPAAALIHPISYLVFGKHDLMVQNDPLCFIFSPLIDTIFCCE